MAELGSLSDVDFHAVLSEWTMAQVRPPVEGDRAELRRLHEGLSESSAYFRYISFSQHAGDAHVEQGRTRPAASPSGRPRPGGRRGRGVRPDWRPAGRLRSELLAVADALVSQPLPPGRRVAVLSNSRSVGVLAGDACLTGGLEV